MSRPVIFQLTQVGKGQRLICFAGGSFPLGGQDGPCSTLPGARSSGGRLLPQPVKTSHTESLPPLSTHTHHSLVNTYIYSWVAQKGVQTATGKRERLSFDLKKSVCITAVKEERRFGVICFVIAIFSFHYTAACSNMWMQDIEWKPNVDKKNVRETFKLTRTVVFSLFFWMFTFAFLLLFTVLPVCW